MIFHKVKNTIANISESLFDLDKLISYRKDRYVLSYHRVINEDLATKDAMHHSLWITPKTFESHLVWMKNVGRIVNSSEFLSDKDHDTPLFLITFDDGWKDTYFSAFPILMKYNAPAKVFLATEAVESGFLFWPQDIATKTIRLLMGGHSSIVLNVIKDCWPSFNISSRPKNKINAMDAVYLWIESLKLADESVRQELIDEYFRQLRQSSTPLLGYILSWDEVREMGRNGFDFGSHTHRHVILEDLSLKLIEQELIQSKDIISDRLQCDVTSFCYPNGRYNGVEGDILSKCGYFYGFCLDNKSLRNRHNNFYIPRFIASERNTGNGAYFKMRLLEAPFFRSKSHMPNMENM